MRLIPMNTVERMWSTASSKLRISSRTSSRRRGGQGRSRLLDRMKRVLVTGLFGLSVIAIAGVIFLHTSAAEEKAGRHTQVSEKAAKTLQAKIDAVKKADETPTHKHGSSRVEVTEAELESYLLYSLKE